jgi:hypothetical protein
LADTTAKGLPVRYPPGPRKKKKKRRKKEEGKIEAIFLLLG